jgi:hypothetical protein
MSKRSHNRTPLAIPWHWCGLHLTVRGFMRG